MFEWPCVLTEKLFTIPRAKEVAGLAAEQLAYSVCEGDRGECVVYSPGSDDLITPEELSAWMLQYLKRQAEAKLRESVTGAVITVPAHFDGRQRGATLFAAENAGLSTVHLLQEPVAAAMAYGINGGTDGETVLVFDLGGGTFDVSVLQAFEGIMEVLGTAGDARLGGDDFDAALAEWIVGRVECEREWALGAARRAKEELSTRDVAVIDAPSGERVELTQETFEAVTLGLFQRMADVLDSIGRDLFVEWAMPPLEAVPGAFGQGEPQPRAASHPERSCTAQPAVQDRWAPPQRRISRVALVGQMTRLPSLRAFVARVTGVAPCMSVDPGEAVALGAATHAGVLVGSVGSVELMDGSFVGELHNRVTGFGEWLP